MACCPRQELGENELQVPVYHAKHEIKLLFTINTYLKQTKGW